MTMKTWDYNSSGGNSKKETGCCSLDSINDARAIAVEKGFPHYILDIREEFGDHVIENFVTEYLAGRTPNPHTLLNFLYARISRSEAFNLWKNAKRNIIDIDDAAAIAGQFIADESTRNVTLNIANPISYSMKEIVAAMEHVVGKRAIYYPLERGSEYIIDISAIPPVLASAGVVFGSDYLEKVLGKYYGNSDKSTPSYFTDKSQQPLPK